MMLLNKIVLAICFLVAFTCAFGQVPRELRLISGHNDYVINERVLCVVDQDFYLAGESINIHALTYDASLQIPIVFSSVLYIELYTQDNNVVASKKILLKEGQATGSIAIPRNLPTDFYYLRAYTNYMKGFGCNSFFTQRLKVVNPFLNNVFSGNSAVDSSEVKIQLAADGGEFVYGLDNKLVLSYGFANGTAMVKLFENERVISEGRLMNGFKTIDFIPYPQYSYRIEMVFSNARHKVIPIEGISHSGVICKLDSVVNDVAYLKLAANNHDDASVDLFVQNNGLNYESNHKGYAIGSPFGVKLLGGLNKLVFKNNSNHTVAHRYVYMQPQAGFTIFSDIIDSGATPGKSIGLTISSNVKDTVYCMVALKLGDAKTLPLPQGVMQTASFASSLASITTDLSDAEDFAHFNSGNINDYLPLLQDMQKPIGDPGNAVFLPELTHDIVSGTVRMGQNKSPAAHQSMYLSFVDSVCWLYRCETDSLGEFRCSLPLYFQGNDLVVSMLDTTGVYNIVVEDEFYPHFTNIARKVFVPDSTLKGVIEKRMLNLQVNDAFSIKPSCSAPSRSALRFYGFPNAEYFFGDYVSLPSLKEFIFEIVQEATPKTKKRKVGIGILTAQKKFGTNPLVVFDGVPLSDIQGLMSLPCVQFQSLRIVPKQFFFGKHSYDGVVDITSKDAAFSLVEQGKNSLRVAFPAVDCSSCQIAVPFDKSIPYYASTLVFGTLKTNIDGCSFDIKLPDNSGLYSLFVFGFTKDGKWSFLVKENIVSGR